MKITKRIVAILICWLALTEVKAAQDKYEPSPEELADLKKNLLNLEKDEKKFGRGTFGTLSGLQEVAGNYAGLKDERCLDYIKRCYDVIRSIKGKTYFNIEDNNAWLVEPKYREAYYYYQIGNITKAQEKAKEALNICLNSRVDGDFKAQLIEKILTMVESFRDGEVLKYGADLESKLLKSNSISADNINALKEAVSVNNVNANNFLSEKKKRNNLIGKTLKDILSEVKRTKTENDNAEEELNYKAPDFITEYERDPGKYFQVEDKNKIIERDSRLMDILTYYKSTRNYARLEEIINKFDELYDSIEGDSIEKVHFGKQIFKESLQYFLWTGKYNEGMDFLKKRYEKISSDVKLLKSIETDCWNLQYNICKAGMVSAIGDRSSLDGCVAEISKLNETVSKETDRPTGHVLAQIAGFYSAIGDSRKALEYYTSALKDLQKWRETLENTKISATNIDSDNFKKLIYDWKESVDMIHETLLGIIDSSQKTGDWQQAIEVQSSFNNFCNDLSKEEYDINQDYEALSLFALNSIHLNDSTNALNIMHKIIEAKNNNLENVLQLPEEDLLSIQIKNYDLSLPAAILEPNKLFDVIVKQKGLVNDVLVKRNLTNYKANPQESTKAAVIRSQIAQLMHKRNSSAASKQLESLRNALLSIERNSAKNIKLDNLKSQIDTISFTEVLKNLTTNQSYIEIFKYRPVCDAGYANEVYAALIASYNSSNVIRVELGSVDKINSLIDQYTKALESGDTNSFPKFNVDLYNYVIKPLLQNTESNNILFISPEDNLNFLPFAAMASSDGTFAGESKNIYYVTTARDFVRPALPLQHSRMALFYNPDFNFQSKNDSNSVISTQINSDQFKKIALSSLPGTAVEANLISEIASKNSISLKKYEGTNATEAIIRSLDEQDIIHLGTHGFYLKSFHPIEGSTRGLKLVASPDDRTSNTNSEIGVDPMKSSGIALAGAQNTLNSWANNIAPNPIDDGIITAEEVASINLGKTWLVTLSACETGRGESKSGEGVFGFRRAFLIAGAQNLLMTLWPVSDDVTPQIMADFYKNALSTGDAPKSLSEVQRDWLVKLRNEKGLLAAVRDAGPFAMVVMANSNAKPSEPSSSTSTTTSQLNPNTSNLTSTIPAASPEGGNILEFADALAKADAGDAYAQGVVSIYYTMGYKVPKDTAKGLTYALKSAAQKNPLGIYQIGVLRELGVGMKKDKAQGRKLMSEAFDGLNTLSGDPYALYDLACMAIEGVGVNQNPKEAARLFKASADMGYAPAQRMFAKFLEAGVGVRKDLEAARQYQSQSTAQWSQQ